MKSVGAVIGVTCLFVLSGRAQTLPPLRYLEPMFTPAVTSGVLFGRNLNPWTSAQQDLFLDVYQPAGDTAQARPAIVYVHGGLFWYGSRIDGPVLLNCNHFCSLGYVCFAIDYRLATSYNHGGLMPDAMAEDIKAAVRFVRKNATTYRIDPERIALAGDSVGGDGSLTASQTTWEGSSGNPGYRSDVNCVLEYWGYPHMQITNPKCAIAIVHGTADPAVSFTLAQQIASQASLAGAPNRLIALPGAGHSPWDRWNTFIPEATGFLYEVLALQQASGIAARAGWSSPGSLTLRAAGWEGQTLFWFMSLRSGQLPVLTWGTLYLDPLALFAIAQTGFPVGSAASTQTLTLTVPGGFQGNLYWQGVYAGGVKPVRFSNLVTTLF